MGSNQPSVAAITPITSAARRVTSPGRDTDARAAAPTAPPAAPAPAAPSPAATVSLRTTTSPAASVPASVPASERTLYLQILKAVGGNVAAALAALAAATAKKPAT